MHTTLVMAIIYLWEIKHLLEKLFSDRWKR
jgi:hypothetical protein